MTQNIKRPVRPFNRTDSASECHDAIYFAKPFAHSSKLADLLDETPKPAEMRVLEEFPLVLPTLPRQAPRHLDVREALTTIGDNTSAALTAMEEGEEGGLRNIRFGTSAGPDTDWAASMGESGARAQLAGERFTLQGSDSYNLSLNRGGASGTVVCGDAGTSLAFAQNVNASGPAIVQSLGEVGGGTDTLRLDAFGASGLRGASLSDSWSTPDGTRLGGTLAAIVIGGTKLAPLRWDDDIASAGGGRILARWESKLMPIVALDLGVSWVHFGASLRGSAYKAREHVYEVYVTPDELGKALRQRHGFGQVVREGLESVGWKRAPVALPVLAEVLQKRQANHLQVGESVRLVRTGNMTGGVTVSVHGLRTGIYASYTGETELIVSRVDDDHLDVVISPKHIMSLSANLDALIAAEVFTSGSVATALSRAYRVDLREETARAALTKLFDHGEYPGCETAPTRLGPHTAVDMAQQVRHGNLPVGVRTLFMQRAEHIEADWGLGVPKPFFLSGRVAGLGLAGKMFERNQVTTDGVAALATKTLGRASSRELWRAGKRYKELTAGVRRLDVLDAAGHPDARFDGLEVKVVKGLTRVVGDARAKLTQKVAKLLGKSVTTPVQKGDAQTYEVTMARLFTQTELAKLGKASRADLLRTAFTVNVPFSALDTLRKSIAELAREHGTDSLAFALRSAAETQAFLVTHGQRAFAAMHALCGGDIEDVDLTVESNVFDKPVQKAFALQLEYGTARDARSLKRGARDAKRVGDKVKQGVSHMADESLLKAFASPDQAAKLSALQKVEREVEQFLTRLEERIRMVPVAADSVVSARG